MIQCVVCEDWLHGRVSHTHRQITVKWQCTVPVYLGLLFTAVCAALGMCGSRLCGVAGDDL